MIEMTDFDGGIPAQGETQSLAGCYCTNCPCCKCSSNSTSTAYVIVEIADDY